MNYKFKTKPYPHQRKALERLLRQRGGGLQIPMRYGKSKIICDFAACLYHLENVKRVLIVTVTSGLGVWEDEIATHFPYPYVVSDWHGEIQAGYPETAKMQFIVVNFANVFDRMNTGGRSWFTVPRDTLTKFNADLVVVDESHHIGNPSTECFKYAHRLGRRARFRVIMTGTMFHRKPFYTFGQINFLDDGKTFGGSFSNFKQKVAVIGGRSGYEVLRYRNLKWMMKEVKKQVLIRKHIQLTEPVHNVIHFNLLGKNARAYKEMDKEKIITVKGEAVVSPIILTKHLRLSMIEGGWVKLPSGKYARVGTDKIEIAEDRLREYMEQGIEKAVIGCRFIPELADLARAAKKLGFKPILFHGGLAPGKERTARIKMFSNYDGPALFISQVATGSQAINLSVADTMMFYSLSESYLIHDQFSRRIEVFEEKRTLQYDYIVPRGGRGEVTLEALKLNKDVAELLAENPRLVERLTRVGE